MPATPTGTTRRAKDAVERDRYRTVALPGVREELAQDGLCLLVGRVEMHSRLVRGDRLRGIVQAVAVDEAHLLIERVLEADVGLGGAERADDHPLVHLLETEPVAILGEDAHDVLERRELRRIDVERLVVESQRGAAIGELVLRQVRHRVERLRLTRRVCVGLRDGSQDVVEARPLLQLRVEAKQLVQDR